MNNLSKEKRNQLTLVVLLIVGVLAGLWFGLIRYQQQSLTRIAAARVAAEQKRGQMEVAIKNAGQIEADVAESSQKLQQLESGMATGDLNTWLINTIRQFKAAYRVDIPQFSQVEGPRDVSLLPSFPYKQAALTVAGTAHFHDLGRFLADLENQFPQFRILNLNLDLSVNSASEDRELLSFRFEIVTLVKPNAS